MGSNSGFYWAKKKGSERKIRGIEGRQRDYNLKVCCTLSQLLYPFQLCNGLPFFSQPKETFSQNYKVLVYTGVKTSICMDNVSSPFSRLISAFQTCSLASLNDSFSSAKTETEESQWFKIPTLSQTRLSLSFGSGLPKSKSVSFSTEFISLAGWQLGMMNTCLLLHSTVSGTFAFFVLWDAELPWLILLFGLLLGE